MDEKRKRMKGKEEGCGMFGRVGEGGKGDEWGNRPGSLQKGHPHEMPAGDACSTRHTTPPSPTPSTISLSSNPLHISPLSPILLPSLLPSFPTIQSQFHHFSFSIHHHIPLLLLSTLNNLFSFFSSTTPITSPLLTQPLFSSTSLFLLISFCVSHASHNIPSFFILHFTLIVVLFP